MDAKVLWAAAAVSTLMLGGCASTITSILDRSVATEEIDDHKVMTMTGERRIVVTGPIPLPHNPNPLRICAESMPDAARAIGASSAATASLPTEVTGTPQTQQFGFNDAVSSALLLTFARTETADVVRQLGWQNCLAYMNGAIKEDGYKANLTSIIDKAFAVLEKRASASPVMPAGSVQVILPGAEKKP